ncbi:hypothetical protein [Pseudomonas trivialis]|uniref:Uncharacterized protein n=1 Tax=Pseudomonas trivialis TaxID=200450 RepID=A0A0H5APM0_9PSED|nr:hypothetical protein [Pseudomonas trivialis]AKS06172.1 hypothetical protein AA957_08650 [Pseudomonas trivialis]
MTTSTAYGEATGTLTASVNGVESFNAGEVYLTNENEQITIVGVEEDSPSPLRIIEIKMLSNTQNGDHVFPGDQIRALIAGGNTAPAHYLTQSGSVNVDFDRENGLYKCHFNFTAKNLFQPKDTIGVVGDCVIHTNPISKQ